MGEIDVAGAEKIGHAFVDARRSGATLTDYPGTIPETLAEAYAAQDAAIAKWGEPVGGWKVGRIPLHLEAQYGSNRLAGPIFAPSIVEATDASLAMPVFEGFAAAEAEFMLRIGTAPAPGKSDYTIEQAAELIDAVHAGIEIASSPFPGINAHGPAVTVSDFGNNYGLIIGPEVADWREAVTQWTLSVAINGEVIATGQGANMLDGPVGAAAFLFNLMARRGIALTPGQWISTGAVTGVHEVNVGDTVEALFDGGHSVRCTIAAF